MKLYELTAAHQQIFDSIMDDEANLDTLEDTLQCVEGAIEVKAENMAKFVLMLKADTEALDTEIGRLTARKKARTNRMDGIKSYLMAQMELIGKDKISTPVLTIALQNNPAALNILDEKQIPTSYLTIIPARTEINKAAVKDALKLGMTVPGAELTQGKGLRIR